MSEHRGEQPPPGSTRIEGWARGAGADPSGQPTVDQVAGRVQTVIDAAEQAAEAIRADAEEQAAAYLEQARRQADELTAKRVRLIAELTDKLIDHADTVRRHSEQMVAALEHGITTVAEANGPGFEPRHGRERAPAPGWSGGSASGEAPAPQTVTTPYAQASPPPRQAAPAGAIPTDALLHATRLAIAGHDRQAVAEAMRADLGIDDAGPILNQVFGRG